MSTPEPITGYRFETEEASHTESYLWPATERELENRIGPGGRVFDLGCGNGAFSERLDKLGYEVTGVDPSVEGIEWAHTVRSHLNLHAGSAYDDLQATYGTFPAIVSLEVVEHVYAPRDYAACVFNLLEPGGTALISTPFHGYTKNVVLALSGKLDQHFTALWDHGHIKFWSRRTLSELLREAGFATITFLRVGRIPVLAKSMIAIAEKPW